MASPRASEPCTAHLAGQDADFCSLADATLLVEGRELPVHSAVLSMHSCWFRGLFASLKDGLAASSSSGELAVEPCEGLEAFCAFLRCLYRPAAAVVKEELVEIREEDGEVLFNYHAEELLALAHQFDAPYLFELVEEVAVEEPPCRLALLMDPLRWLLICDEYQHLGHLQKLRSTAVSFLTAKFGAMQSDPRLERLSPATLAEVVRMAGYRLATLAGSCGHVQAVQDRAAQRFTATAQQVAAGYCPDAAQAAAFVTHWWLNPTTNCIKLSWSQREAAQHAQQAAAEPLAAQPAAGPAALAQQQQQQQQAEPEHAPEPAALPGAGPAEAASLAQAAALQQILNHTALMQQQVAQLQLLAAAGGWGNDDGELSDGDDELVPLLEAAAYYLPQQAQQQQQQQPADAVMLQQLSATHAQLAAAAAAAGAPRAQRPARRQRKVLRFLPY